MALKKAITTNFGVSVEYWKICNIIEDYIAKQIKITLGGYVSSEARLSGASPLTCLVENLNGENCVADMNREAMYEALKETEQWSDAEDC